MGFFIFQKVESILSKYDDVFAIENYSTNGYFSLVA